MNFIEFFKIVFYNWPCLQFYCFILLQMHRRAQDRVCNCGDICKWLWLSSFCRSRELSGLLSTIKAFRDKIINIFLINFQLLSLVSNIGGLLGIICGMSIFSMLEIVFTGVQCILIWASNKDFRWTDITNKSKLMEKMWCNLYIWLLIYSTSRLLFLFNKKYYLYYCFQILFWRIFNNWHLLLKQNLLS